MNQTANTEPSRANAGARMGLGTAIGMAMGLLIGLLLDSSALGLGMGVALGAAMGLALSGQRQQPSRPLTIVGVVLVLVGIVFLAVIMSLVRPQWWCDHPVLNLFPGC